MCVCGWWSWLGCLLAVKVMAVAARKVTASRNIMKER